MPPLDPVTPSAALPPRADVVVVGGGIVGASAALFLARDGVSVALCEKGAIGAEQSSRNWGWCRAMGRDTREIPLIQRSLAIWRGIDRLAGADLGFRSCGILYLHRTERELARYGPWLEAARAHQIGSRLVTAREAAELLPGGLAFPAAGGLFTPTDGRAEPGVAAPGIARAAQAAGASVLTGCAVRGVETRGGRVSGVVTERGRIGCDAVLVAGGAWSRLFLGHLGVKLPQLHVRASVLRTAPMPGPDVSAAGPDFAFRRRADGGYSVAHGGLSEVAITPDAVRLAGAFLPALRKEWRALRPWLGGFADAARTPRRWADDAISPFERVRILNPAPSAPILDAALANLRRAHPAFAQAREAERWGGMIDVTPDAVPVISGVADRPGLFVATGFSGHGFGIGPGAGEMAAALVQGRTPAVDPAPFRLARFREGRAVVEAGF